MYGDVESTETFRFVPETGRKVRRMLWYNGWQRSRGEETVNDRGT